jgi:hypothetical protein
VFHAIAQPGFCLREVDPEEAKLDRGAAAEWRELMV